MVQDVSRHCNSAIDDLKLPLPLPLAPGDDGGKHGTLALWSRLIAAAQHDSAVHIPHTPSLQACARSRIGALGLLRSFANMCTLWAIIKCALAPVFSHG